MSSEKKLKILASGDIHGDTNLAKELAEKAEKNKLIKIKIIAFQGLWVCLK